MLSTSRFCCSVQATKMLYKRFIWSKLPLAPPDKILGLNEMFNNDSSLSKVNLGVGAYRDEIGKPKVLPSVKKAKDILSASSTGHEYAGIAGLSEFVEESIKLAYGTNAEVIQSKRVAAVQALSGTGACRLFAEFIAKFYGRGTRVYLPNPTVSTIIATKNLYYDCIRNFSYFNYYTPVILFLLLVGKSCSDNQECRSRTGHVSLL